MFSVSLCKSSFYLNITSQSRLSGFITSSQKVDFLAAAFLKETFIKINSHERILLNSVKIKKEERNELLFFALKFKREKVYRSNQPSIDSNENCKISREL